MTKSRSKTLVLTKAHVYAALTTYLGSMSFIPDDHEVVKIMAVPEGYEVTSRISNDD